MMWRFWNKKGEEKNNYCVPEEVIDEYAENNNIPFIYDVVGWNDLSEMILENKKIIKMDSYDEAISQLVAIELYY